VQHKNENQISYFALNGKYRTQLNIGDNIYGEKEQKKWKEK
jgi:hypothetical protein